MTTDNDNNNVNIYSGSLCSLYILRKKKLLIVIELFPKCKSNVVFYLKKNLQNALYL